MIDHADAVLAQAEDVIEEWLCEVDQACAALLAEAATEAQEVRSAAWLEAGQILDLARDEARAERARIVAEAEREAQRLRLEAAAEATQLLSATAEQLPRITAEAHNAAEAIRREARAECAQLLAAAGELAAQRRSEAEAEFERIRAIAAEHAEAVRALADADAAAARGAAREDLSGIREAVDRLRAELSHVVDAAFDALPAVEATAGALDRVWQGEGPASPADAGPGNGVVDLRDLVEAPPEDACGVGGGMSSLDPHPVDLDLTGMEEPVLVGAGPRRPSRLRRLLRLAR